MTEPRALLLLRESSPPQRERISNFVAAEIVRLGIATVTPLGDGSWLVSGVAKVGVIRVGDTELRIEPKVPLDRIFFLLSRTLEWGAWRDEDVRLDSVDDFYPAIGELFTRAVEQVLRAGILRSYREHHGAENVIRGRWLVSEQIRKRHGLPLPIELSYDEFTADIDENRLLRSAIRRLLRTSVLAPSLSRRLHRLEAQLCDAQFLVPGRPLPRPKFDRRNARYQTAIGLARLVLEDASLDRGIAEVSASGFLLAMPILFERFVEVEVTRAAQERGGVIQAQRRDYLDLDAQIVVKPDLVWLRDGLVCAVFDAKYKAEKPSGYPNADVYQMLAYCIRHGVNEGHLVYAAGNEVASRFVIEQAGVTVVCHAIALDAAPQQIMTQIDRIIEGAIGVRRHDAGTRVGALTAIRIPLA